MEQSFLERVFKNYAHLKGKYIGCFCKDEMDKLSQAIKLDKLHSLQERTFALINSGTNESNGEHWMGVVMNKITNSCDYFDSFGRSFKWLNKMLAEHFDNLKRDT